MITITIYSHDTTHPPNLTITAEFNDCLFHLVPEMEQPSKNGESSAPILCRNNCGFFGNPATNNFCSKCYKEYYLRSLNSSVDLREKEKDVKDEVKVKRSDQVDEAQGAGFVGERIGPSEETTVQFAAKQPANRCAVCKRKVGLMGFKCRCENVFCSVHRYSDKHECNFNYREAGQDTIAKANPIVKADKIDRI